MTWREVLKSRLPPFAVMMLNEVGKEAEYVRELRFRMGCPAEIVSSGRRIRRPEVISREMMDELLRALTAASFYAFDRQMAQGYIPLPGGHRAGLCGRLVPDDRGGKHLCDVTSVCIRIAHSVPDASCAVRRHLCMEGIPLRVLILGPPGCGKTTLLRDAARWLSTEKGLQVAAADEREELFPDDGMSAGIDVMYGEKGTAMMMMIRSMSPQVIVCDEIGCEADVSAICEAARCGIGLLASAHADDIRSVMRRPSLKRAYKAGVFDRYILLGAQGGRASVYDSRLIHIEP